MNLSKCLVKAMFSHMHEHLGNVIFKLAGTVTVSHFKKLENYL